MVKQEKRNNATVSKNGGGQPGAAPVSKGAPPLFSPRQVLAPKMPVLALKLAVEPTIDVDPSLNMSDIGMAKAPAVGVSMGNGRGNGLGGGSGNGMGPGSGGGTGRDAAGRGWSERTATREQAGGGVLRGGAESQGDGTVLVNLLADVKRSVTRARAVQGMGMGLSERAVEAVRQYRFRPAMENGKPLKVVVNVEIDFHIFRGHIS